MQKLSRRRLFPTYYASSVEDVTPEFIRACGCSAVLSDIDNTISHVDAPDAVPMAEEWMRRIREAGIAFALISNNDPPRVEPFAQKYGAEFVCHAQKPQTGGYREIAARLARAPEQCLVVGDQLFTDVLGGNAAGMRTVIVDPLCESEDPLDFRKRRKMEKLLLRFDRFFSWKKRHIGG